MNRRGFFATFLAALGVSRFLPKTAPAIPAIEPLKIPIVVSNRAVPGRIDFINLKNWYRIETKPEDYLEFGKLDESSLTCNFKLVMQVDR